MQSSKGGIVELDFPLLGEIYQELHHAKLSSDIEFFLDTSYMFLR